MARSIAGAAPGRTNRRFLIIAILCAALSAVLVYTAVSRTGGDDGGGGGGAAGSTQIVVAETAIKQRTLVTPEMITLKSVSSRDVIAGAFTSVDDVVGKVTKYPIEANQQVIASAVIDTSNPTALDALALVVPAGKRGFSINSAQVKTAGGLILPGDYVDVLWICCDDQAALAKTVLQNVQVAAVAQTKVDAGPAAGTAAGTQPDDPAPAVTADPIPDAVTLTLLLTPDQAHLAFLADLTGEVRASLRGVGDANLEPPSNDFTLATELLPIEVLQTLPRGLWPDGYKEENQ
jgi:Flp pilus assembly protein CpaB